MEKKRLLEFRMPGTGELLTFKTRQYFVTDTGQVWNDDLKRYVKLHERDSHIITCLTDDSGKQRTKFGVHNLVATCFLRLLQKGEVVHHVDKNPQNNNLSNLKIISASEHSRQHNYERWASGTYDGVAAQASERAKKAWAAGAYEGHGEKMRKAWKNSVRLDCEKKKVAQLSLDGKLVNVWPSVNESGRNGYDQGAVSCCCNGKRHHKTHKGFRWMWYEDYLAQHDKPVDSQPVQLEMGSSPTSV